MKLQMLSRLLVVCSLLLFTLMFAGQNPVEAGIVLGNLDTPMVGNVFAPAAFGFEVPAGGLNYQLNGVTVGLYVYYAADVSLSVHTDNYGAPGALIGSFSAISATVNGYGYYSFTAEGTMILSAGQRYWIAGELIPGIHWGASQNPPAGTFTYTGSLEFDAWCYLVWGPFRNMNVESQMVISLDASPTTDSATGTGLPQARPDHRLNWLDGDQEGVVYVGRDDAGNPSLHVYGVNANSRGYLLLVVTEDDVVGYAEQPAENTLVMQSEDGFASFYILTTGEYQVNIGPNEEGKVYVYIGVGLAMEGLYSYMIDPQTMG